MCSTRRLPKGQLHVRAVGARDTRENREYGSVVERGESERVKEREEEERRDGRGTVSTAARTPNEEAR